MLRPTLLAGVAAAVFAAGLMLLPQLAGAAVPTALPGNAVLSLGSSGAQVRILQSDLSLLQDPPGPIDGIFGPRTRSAVREFQGYVGRTVDGVVDAATWSEIQTYLDQEFHATSGSLATSGADYGDVGAPVVQLQQILLARGENPGPVNGVYDMATRSALFAFESTQGLGRATAVDSALARALGASASSATGSAPAQGSSSGSSSASTPPSSSGSASGSPATIDGRQVLNLLHLTATAYSPSLQDNYPYGAVDYFGRPLVAGDVAVDPRVIPLNTRLWVTGYSSPFLPAGGFLAHAVDEGSAIKGMRIDLFINQSESNVSNFGIQPVKVYVLGN